MILNIGPLKTANFSLDLAGITGLLGGDEWLAAISSKQFMRHRRHLGWYNSPGSYYMAKQYGMLSNSRLWNGLFPGPSIPPATMLELDSREGPRYFDPHSSTRLDKTGHIAYLVSRYCAQMGFSPNNGRATAPRLTIEHEQQHGNISVTIVNLPDILSWPQFPDVPEELLLLPEPFYFLVSSASVVGIVLSALWGDWYSFASIWTGIISGGVSSFVLGSGTLTLQYPPHSPRSGATREAILFSRNDIIVLKGGSNSVNSIIRGRYDVRYFGAPTYHHIGFSSLLLLWQFILQLFLIRQGQLIGQIMFLSTFIISWAYNVYLASIDREALQTEVFFKILGMPKFEKLNFKRWSEAAAFVAFYTHPAVLNELIPSTEAMWSIWRDLISIGYFEGYDPVNVPELRLARKKIDTLDPEERAFVLNLLEAANQAQQQARSLKLRDEAGN